MLGVILVKISITFFFLLRIMLRKPWQIFLWSSAGKLYPARLRWAAYRQTTGILICYAIACSATLIFQCTPISASWSISLRFQPTTHCLSPHIYVSLGLANSVANILTDVLFAVIPIPVVLRLRLNKRSKASLIAVLSLGFNACIAGIFKTRLQVTTVKAMDSASTIAFRSCTCLSSA
jgi:hypothetical protein